MRRLTLVAALVALCAAVVASSVAAPPRQRSEAEARLPSAANPAGRGLMGAAAWLTATGRASALVRPGDPAPRDGDVWLLLAPAAPLTLREAGAFVAHAERGGLSVWALSARPQPALESLLSVTRTRGRGERTVAGLPGHPLLGGLALRAGGEGLSSLAPGARPLTGPDEPAALSLPIGRGEVLVLNGPELLDDAHLPQSDALSLLVRLSARGRVAFDERWLRPAGGAPPPRLPAVAGAQLLLAALLLLLALGRRHGAVRPPPPAGSRRTARDYLATLAALSRRAGAEPELAAASFARLRRRLEREAGVPARLGPEEAARRLDGRSPAAAAALRRGQLALSSAGPGQLLAVTRAAADVLLALRRHVSPAPGLHGEPGED